MHASLVLFLHVQARAAGKHVVLVGDLNLRARVQDTAAEMTIVNLDLLRMSTDDALKRVRDVLRDIWPDVSNQTCHPSKDTLSGCIGSWLCMIKHCK